MSAQEHKMREAAVAAVVAVVAAVVLASAVSVVVAVQGWMGASRDTLG